MKHPEIKIGDRLVGMGHPPLVIAEIGINHEGSFAKAVKMIDDAVDVGCECVKFQCHVIDDEMIPNDVVPGNAHESIWDIMARCSLNEAEERELMGYCQKKGVIFLSTPFSRAAANRLERRGVSAYKIGSGECNNFPLIEHIAAFGKPIILSTGMNTIETVQKSVSILRKYGVPYALMHCTSIYPTPYEKIRLGVIDEFIQVFPDAVVGLSDHSLSIMPCLGAIALGASIVERHFVSDMNWPGPDVEISLTPETLRELLNSAQILYKCRGGRKNILAEEQPTIDFAYASVVSTSDIKIGEMFTRQNLWVKRPGTGEFLAKDYENLLGKRTVMNIPNNSQIRKKWVTD